MVIDSPPGPVHPAGWSKAPELLDRDNRRRVFESIRASPWICIPDLCAATGLSRSSVRHHLRALVRHRLVRVHRDGRVLRYAEVARGVGPHYESPVGSRLRTLLRSGSQPLALAMRELVGGLGYSRYGAWKAIRRAEQQGLARLERRGVRVWVEPPTLFNTNIQYTSVGPILAD